MAFITVPGVSVLGCTGSCELSVAASGITTANIALGALAGIVGTWGLVEQWKLQNRITELAERSSDRSDNFLTLATDKYNTVDRPTFDLMRALFDRYSARTLREDAFLDCAFSLKSYCPDYCLAEGRALSSVQRVFDLSFKARRRSLSPYATGRACHDMTYFATRLAEAKVNAATDAYNRERAKKLAHDKWYWERWKDGANYLISIGNRAVNAITAGAAGLSTGIAGIGQSVAVAAEGASGQAGALANSAQFWGNVASGGLNGFGQAVGAGYFNSQPSQPVDSGWQTTTYVAPPAYSGSLKD